MNERYGRHRDPGAVDLYCRVAIAYAEPAAGSDAATGRDRIAALAADQPAPPAAGSDDLHELDEQVHTFASTKSVDYWTAASKVLGDQALAEREMPPFKLEEFDVAVDEQRAELDRRARDATRRLQIGYVDAVGVVQLDDELAAAEADAGHGELPWLDTSTARPPQPYGAQSLEDWERDKLRAKAAGVDLHELAWRHAAEEGRDLVHETAVEARVARVRSARAQRDSLLEQARSVERANRERELNASLDRRARQRLGRG